MSDQALSIPAPASLPDLPKDPKRPAAVTPKVKAAIDMMVEDGKRWEDAATDAGLTVRAMRKALEKPEVVRYLRARKQVFRASVSAANISVLAEIRDKGENQMARLGAIRMLEQMDDEPISAGGSMRSAGVTIVINAGNHSAHVVGDQAKTLELQASVSENPVRSEE